MINRSEAALRRWFVVGAVALMSLTATACSANTDNADADQTIAQLEDQGSADDETSDQDVSSGERAAQIVLGARDEIDPETVAPQVDPPAFLPTWVPDGFEITRASAASPDFMSILLSATDTENPATASLIWGDELSAFESLADQDPDSQQVEVHETTGTLFTFASDDDSVGPALFWRAQPDVPVLVIGSADFSSDEIEQIAAGVERTTQQEFVDLAIALAEAELLDSTE